METFIGMIALFPYIRIPAHWTECAGQICSISEHQALFSLLGTTYGGDGQNTFALPDLRGKAPAENLKYCISLEGIYPSM